MTAPGRLRDYQLRLAVAEAVLEGVQPNGEKRRATTEEDLIEKLWREDPDMVRRVFREVIDKRADANYRMMGYRGDTIRPGKSSATRGAPIVSTAKREKLTRNKIGLTLSEIAERTGITKPTLAALLEHHGFLELVPHGGRQNRRLVSDTAFHAGVGHNVMPENRIGHLEGYNRAAAFPVFYEERLPDVLSCLNYDGFKDAAAALPTKRARLSWLLTNHGYLPDREIAELAGGSVVGVEKARQRGRKSESMVASYKRGCPDPEYLSAPDIDLSS